MPNPAFKSWAFGFRHTFFKIKKIYYSYCYTGKGSKVIYSPFPRTPATIPMMNTAARTNRPSARKLNAVPVLVRTLVSEVDRTEVLMLGMDDSMLATTTRPTIIVTAAITTVKIKETISIPPSAFLNMFIRTPPLILMWMVSIYKGVGILAYPRCKCVAIHMITSSIPPATNIIANNPKLLDTFVNDAV